MGWSFNIGFGNNRPIAVDYDNGEPFYTIFSSRNALGKKLSAQEKYNAVISNPALLKVIAMDCDIFSMGKINKYSDDKIIEVDYLYNQTKKPNFFQSWTQFLWDYKFWLNIYGNAYLYNPNNSKILNENSSLQWLDPSKIDWEKSVVDKLKSFIFSKKSYNDVLKQTVKYTFDNGTTKRIALSEIIVFTDLSNAGQCNPLTGISRIDALYKVIKNSELALDAKAINLEFAQKFFVTGKADPDNVQQIPMAEGEKISIEQSVRSSKRIHATKTQIDIKRFVENMAQLKLDEAFYNDYVMFGAMFNYPKEVLDANLRGSTYENQEKAMVRVIEYCQRPKGQMLTDSLESQFGYEDLRMSWKHLSFNQVVEKDRAEKIEIQLRNIEKAKELGGLSESEVKQMVTKIINE